MPELPEVEQVRKTLLPHIKGKTITKVEVYLDRLVKHPSSEQFNKNLSKTWRKRKDNVDCKR